jgi:general secretion pathway protein E/type IV pilus assembly protein PilB
MSSQYSIEFCEENKVLFESEDSDGVTVITCNDNKKEILDILRFHHKKEVNLKSVDPVEFASLLGKMQSETNESEQFADNPNNERLLLDKIANDAPIINFVNSLLIDAIRIHASDIHLESFSDTATVRFRIDGVLSLMHRLTKDRFAGVATRLKVMAGLNIMERRLPQDGRITVDLGSDHIDMRASFVPIVKGESIVLRLFNEAAGYFSLENLGIDARTLSAMDKMLNYPHGLILVTGPTGSGKTTTLYALLKKIKTDALKIISIEDPVENIVNGVDQIQTNEAIGLTFESILRRVLRQDPNVIMVGEIRDQATAELVVRAALTGHLVLSTLHTNDSVSAIFRLKNLGIESYLIAGVLRGAIAQRLVRRLCPHCAVPAVPSLEEKEVAGQYGIDLSLSPKPAGCPVCKNTGFMGRIPVLEYYTMNEKLEQAIALGEPLSNITAILRNDAFKSLQYAGLALVQKGVTSFEEIRREVDL